MLMINGKTIGANAKDITGQRFGMLVAIRPVDKKACVIWECKCDCGSYTRVPVCRLRSGNTKSCGCNQHPIGISRNKKHGYSDTRLYQTYASMISRCTVDSPRNKRYFGRGIKICDEWLGEGGLENFIKWALANGYSDDLTIDRIDVNGNYCPENCRWATRKQQCNNRTSNRYITYNGETKTVAEWSETLGINKNTLLHRFTNGWDVEDAMTRPVRRW